MRFLFHDDQHVLIFPRLPIELLFSTIISRTHLRFVASFAGGSQQRCRLPLSPASRRNGSRRLYTSSDRRKISAHQGKVVIHPGARQFSPVTWLKQLRWQQQSSIVYPSLHFIIDLFFISFLFLSYLRYFSFIHFSYFYRNKHLFKKCRD